MNGGFLLGIILYAIMSRNFHWTLWDAWFPICFVLSSLVVSLVQIIIHSRKNDLVFYKKYSKLLIMLVVLIPIGMVLFAGYMESITDYSLQFK